MAARALGATRIASHVLNRGPRPGLALGPIRPYMRAFIPHAVG
jgi:hypothetical protein